ncbi:MAG TPA: hypothetical protein VEC16_06285 [Alphaproteobacteria bacterium]|nr:hypothetical protein [Alphaproteobacteria bacterium]
MMDLTKDLFARLAISAQKDRALNYRFRISKEKFNFLNSEYEKKHHPTQEQKEESLENVLYNHPVPSPLSETPAQANEASAAASKAIRSRVKRAEKIDERVDRIANHPELAQIRAELEFSEELLKKIKAVDAHNPKIASIEETIFSLKKLLHEKSYY